MSTETVGHWPSVEPTKPCSHRCPSHFVSGWVCVQSALDENLDSLTGPFALDTRDQGGNAIRLDTSGVVAATRIQRPRLESPSPSAAG